MCIVSLVGEQATQAQSTEGAAETAAPLTAEGVSTMIAEALKGITAKYNGELAALRKQVRTPAQPATETPAAGQGAAETAAQPHRSDSLTLDDLRAVRELGRLEAKLPAALASQLDEDEEYQALTPREQAATLRRLMRLAEAVTAQAEPTETPSAGAPETGIHRGETPATKPRAKANVPARRETVPVPRTQREWLALIEKDRAAAEKILAEHESFDPAKLPRG